MYLNIYLYVGRWEEPTESLHLSTRLIQKSLKMKANERDKQFFPIPRGRDTE